MKLIVAVINPVRLEAVHDALNPDEARVVSATTAVDGWCCAGSYRGGQFRVPRPRLRMEVLVVNDLAVRDAVQAIARATGEVDGIVWVSEVDELIRLPRVGPSLGSAEELALPLRQSDRSRTQLSHH